MSVSGGRSLGRSPYLERGAFRGSGHVSYDRSGHAIEQNSLRNKPERTKKPVKSSFTKEPVKSSFNSITNLPEPTMIAYETFGQKIEGLPVTESFIPESFTQMYSDEGGHIPFQEQVQGPFTIPDGSNLIRKPRNQRRRRGSRSRSRARFIGKEPTPIPILKKDTSCGSSECNLYWDTSKNQYISDSLSRCTCCSVGKKCRNDEMSPKGVKYNDCCVGLKCSSKKGSMYGSCS